MRVISHKGQIPSPPSAGDDSPTSPPAPVHDRYERFDQIAWFRRDRVQQARVLVLGAGALGNETLKNLALFGVGRIAVCDFDRVELSNLSRSPLFTEADVGENKAVAAARALGRVPTSAGPAPRPGPPLHCESPLEGYYTTQRHCVRNRAPAPPRVVPCPSACSSASPRPSPETG